jgi:hypothetical protein
MGKDRNAVWNFKRGRGPQTPLFLPQLGVTMVINQKNSMGVLGIVSAI